MATETTQQPSPQLNELSHTKQILRKGLLSPGMIIKIMQRKGRGEEQEALEDVEAEVVVEEAEVFLQIILALPW